MLRGCVLQVSFYQGATRLRKPRTSMLAKAPSTKEQPTVKPNHEKRTGT